MPDLEEETPEPRRRSNTQVITDLMELSRCGALMQAFVLEALRRYAKGCLEAGPEYFDTPGLVGRAWHSCAAEAHEALEQHLSLEPAQRPLSSTSN